MTLKGSGKTVSASAQHNSEAIVAKQQAALDLLHQLQQAILDMLTASQPDLVHPTTMQSSTQNSTSPSGQTISEGDVENSMPEIGNVVQVQYQLILNPTTGTSRNGELTNDNDTLLLLMLCMLAACGA